VKRGKLREEIGERRVKREESGEWTEEIVKEGEWSVERKSDIREVHAVKEQRRQR
jgi:hypothetical protein